MSFRGPPPDLSRFHSILVNNLPENTSAEELSDLFKAYGEVGDVYLPRDRDRNSHKSFGFVRFHDKAVADAALEADGTELHGNKIGVQEAKYGRRERDRESGGSGRGRDYESRDYRGGGRDGGGRDDRGGGDYRRDYDRDREPYRGGGFGGGGGGRGGQSDHPRRRSYSRSRSPPRHRDRSPPGRYRD